MIGKLKGIIDSLTTTGCILDVSGVGYEVAVPGRVLSQLVVGDAVSLVIHTQVREDDISLYGFTEPLDKQIFLELIKVSGIGAKTALNILGIMTATEIADAASIEDKASFTRVSGIGAKAASRIITDLKDKIGKIAGGDGNIVSLPTANVTPGQTSLVNDAVSALENLGYSKGQALQAVKESVDESDDVSKLIGKSLRLLGR